MIKKIKFNKNSIAAMFVVGSFVFSFTLPNTLFAASTAGVNLGSAANFVVLAKTGISTTGPTSITGDIGVSPITSSAITGFALTLPAASAFSTSALVTGKVYAADYAVPTPTTMTTAVSDMQTAYTDAMGRTNPTATELGAGNIGGMTLAPGLYKWGTGVTIPTDVTLAGSSNDVWIFQIAQNLNVSSATKVLLSGGAQASNIFWVVAGQTTIGTTAVFNGNILDQTAIVLNTGATLNGRALAQTAVTLDSNGVTTPGSSSSTTSSNQGGGINPIGTATPAYIYPGAGVTSQVSPTTTNTYIAGCTSTTLFSVTTGQSCTGSSISVITPLIIPGCNNGSVGFSKSTGQSCVGNTFTAMVMTSYNFGTTTLMNGSTGVAVMDLQKFLNAKLSLGLVVDGEMGPKTIAVVKQWQMNNGLDADGMVGIKTKAKMNAAAL